MDPRLREIAPIPALVIRDGRITFANAAAAALVGLPPDQIVGRPHTEFLPAEDAQRIVDRQQQRREANSAPAEYESTLQLPGGTRIPVLLFAALAGPDLVIQLLDVRDRAEHRTRLTALARLGALVQHEVSDYAVFQVVRGGLEALGLRPVLVRPEGEGLRLAPVPADSEHSAEGEQAGPPRAWTDHTRRVWQEGAAYADDWTSESGLLSSEDPAGGAGGRYSRAIGVRIDVGEAPSSMLFVLGDWLLDGDLPAFRLFGAQVSAALDAARTIRDLRSKNEELAALNRLAETAASAPNLPTFFQRAGDELVRSLPCDAVAIYLHDEEQDEMVLAHEVGGAGGVLGDAPGAPVSAGFAGWFSLERGPRLLQREDCSEEARRAFDGTGFATLAAVPLKVRAKTVGVLSAGFRVRRDADAAHLSRMQAMAAPFAAAVEAQRLLEDLRGRVSELTLLNDVAVASANLDPALLVENALRRILVTFESDTGVAFLVQGTQLVPVAHMGISEDKAHVASRFPPSEGPAGEAVRRLAPVLLPRAGEWEERRRFFHDKMGIERAVAVPLQVKNRALGALLIGRRRPRPFQEGEVSLLGAIASQLGVAVENAELYAEARRHAGELGLLLEVGRSLVATLELKQVLDAGVRNLARIVDAPDAYLFLVDSARGRLEVRAAAGDSPELGGASPPRPGLDSLAALVFERREPVVLENGAGGAGLDPGPLGVAQGQAYLGLPLVVRERTIGVALIVDPRGPRRFSPAEVDRAAAIANQLAVAVENARLYDDLRRSYAELARAQAQLVQQERLAALGELSAVVAHEVRNPLGVIFNSLGSLKRLLRPQGDAKMLLDIVGEEADRLNRIVGDLLDFARPSTPTLRPEPLDRLLDEVVAAALGDNPHGIVLEREIDPALPPVAMDARLMRQAVLNVAVNAVQAMQRGGTLAVRARRDDRTVRVDVADTGAGIPDEVRHRIFEPFFTTKASGTGLGLAVVKRIVEGHGGEVSLESRLGQGTVFTIRLPIEQAVSSSPAAARTG